MIIIGYQGIGKSTLASYYPGHYVDLESSHFNNDLGKKEPGWHIPYCKIAEDLSSKGLTVFVSCHKEVQEYLQESEEFVTVCYPALELKDLWISRLTCRYGREPSQKNLNALNTAQKWYNAHIKALIDSPFEYKLEICDINYDLHALINNFAVQVCF